MNHFPTSTVLAKLRNAASSSSQIEALRELKNAIIGHEEQKESVLKAGVVGPLARILVSSVGNHKKRQETTGDAAAFSPSKDRDQEEVCCQAIIIIGSLARGECRPSLSVNLGLRNRDCRWSCIHSLNPFRARCRVTLRLLRSFH